MTSPTTRSCRSRLQPTKLWSTSMDLEGTLKLPKEKEAKRQAAASARACSRSARFRSSSLITAISIAPEWQADAGGYGGGRVFWGLTVGCARCHDHKFDPISQRDYYRMSALFAGSVEREIPLVSLFDIETNSRSFPLARAGADSQGAWQAAADAGARGRRRKTRSRRMPANRRAAMRSIPNVRRCCNGSAKRI